MLECWQEHPRDRPNFSQLREKFSSLLLATTSDAYMELEVDNDKLYYTMGEEEEKMMERSESFSSDDSDQPKKEKGKIEKPKWAQHSNTYITTPSTFKEDHVVVEDEHYRAHVDIQEEPEKPADLDADESAVEEAELDSFHAPLAVSFSSASAQMSMQQESVPVSLEDQVGIPLSFVTGEKPAQPRPHAAAKKIKSNNPYVDDPMTMQPLAEEDEDMRGTLGSLTATELSLKLRGPAAIDGEAITPF